MNRPGALMTYAVPIDGTGSIHGTYYSQVAFKHCALATRAFPAYSTT